MYIKSLNLLLVNIPKCGTNTVRRAIEGVHGKCALPGHLRISQARDYLGHDVEAWALIREPWSRFTSALNFVYGDSDISLDDAMNGALRHDTIVFKSQCYFLDGTVTVIPFEDIGKLIEALGYTGPPIHENKSLKRWTVEDIKSHDRADEVGGRYFDDFRLREASKTGASSPAGNLLCGEPHPDQ